MSSALRRIWPLAVLIIAAGCGSHAPSTVATVGKVAISRTELDTYVRYVAGFDALAYPESAEASCARKMAGTACDRVRRQALIRLIQEHLVLRYANIHHIGLTADDRDQIEVELAQLQAGNAPTRGLFSTRTVTRGFMREVLRRQLLVQKAQTRVAGARAVRGTELHIRKLTIPAPPSADRKAIYQQAVSVATGGAPPRGTIIRKEWVAPFHLAAKVGAALQRAHEREYVGPFLRDRSYLLVQLLGSGSHRYGAPAHQEIESKLFHKWLRRAALRAPVRCLDPQNQLQLCPAQIMKNV